MTPSQQETGPVISVSRAGAQWYARKTAHTSLRAAPADQGPEKYSDSGEVIPVYLLPKHTGKGYGRQLMRTEPDALKQRRSTEAFLWVIEGNERAMRSCEAFGFKRTEDCLNGSIGGIDVREISYVYPLR